MFLLYMYVALREVHYDIRNKSTNQQTNQTNKINPQKRLKLSYS